MILFFLLFIQSTFLFIQFPYFIPKLFYIPCIQFLGRFFCILHLHDGRIFFHYFWNNQFYFVLLYPISLSFKSPFFRLYVLRMIIIIIITIFYEFLLQFSRVYRTLLRILTALDNALVIKVLILPLISTSPSLFSKYLQTIPSASSTTGITVTLKFTVFLARSMYLFIV